MHVYNVCVCVYVCMYYSCAPESGPVQGIGDEDEAGREPGSIVKH